MKITAFTCDECGETMKPDQRTRSTIRYEGPVVSGQIEQDLCPECAPSPVDPTLQPLRRRRRLEVSSEGPEAIKKSVEVDPKGTEKAAETAP